RSGTPVPSDWGLAEWHPCGCSIATSDLSDFSGEGTYKVVTDVDTALAFALTLLRVMDFQAISLQLIIISYEITS
ncbi:hypothetical protein, partial [Porphyromonas sp. HMSC077F02]|uniref:hypothetical protein n=1 Tax=Porphyromonas sp. HMSC077F02 TaxID=1739529 RepID=UPI001AEFC5FC